MTVASDDAPAGTPSPTARPILVGAARPDEARRLLSVATRVARARGAEVLLVYSPAPTLGGLPGGGEVDDRELLPSELSVRVTVQRGLGRLETMVRAAAHQHDAGLLILEWRDPPVDGEGTAQERAVERRGAEAVRRLFLDPPCEAWLLRGGLGGREVRSLLVVPAHELPAPQTLDAARVLRGAGAQVTVLDVHSDRREEASAELRRAVEEVLGHGLHLIRQRRASSRERAAIAELEEHAYDLILVEAPEDGVLPALAAPQLPEELARRSPAPALILNRPQSRAAVTFRRWWDRVYGWTQSLDDEQQIRVYSDLRRSARADRDFITLTVLATAIAALGLLLNSAAVVIGAMLVAPFMSPLIALGLAVVHGDPRFMRVAASSVLRGTLVAYPIGVLLGVLVPQVELGSEVLGRTAPSGLDLLVALFSGAAGAYAYSRRELSAALPGVAIAAALVPPLAASGIALGSGEVDAAARAALLYALNVGAIAIAAALVFLWFGFRPEAQRFGRLRTFVRGFALIVVLVTAVFAGVVLLGAQDREEARLERSVTGAVETWLAERGALVTLEVTDEGESLRVRLAVEWRQEAASSTGEPPAAELAGSLADELGRPVEVELTLLPVLIGAAEPGAR